jgi:flavin-dependent dehydrogenase
MHSDVFIIGGGPAGLAAGIAARRRGLTATVADAAIPPIDKACGEGIMPDGLDAARAIGLDLAVPSAQRFHGIRFYDGDVSVGAEFPRGSGLGIKRTALHEFLMERAAEARVRMLWGARVTGLSRNQALVNGLAEHADWIVGADGERSHVRLWAGLDAASRDTRRFGFRRHFRLPPGAEMPRLMEVHWGQHAQLYLTPVGEGEVCVASVGRNRLRVEHAIEQFAQVAQRLRTAQPIGSERGAITATRRLKRVVSGNVALIGDASGSVDAVTGEGLCLLFQQAAALADGFAAGDLERYQRAHARLMLRPRLMADLLLTMDGRKRWRSVAMGAMARAPWLFRGMLYTHIGQSPARP